MRNWKIRPSKDNTSFLLIHKHHSINWFQKVIFDDLGIKLYDNGILVTAYTKSTILPEYIIKKLKTISEKEK